MTLFKIDITSETQFETNTNQTDNFEQKGLENMIKPRNRLNHFQQKHREGISKRSSQYAIIEHYNSLCATVSSRILQIDFKLI